MQQRLAIVLAAGIGTRMKSDLPKVLFPVCGRPMIHYVLDALEEAGIDRTLVVVGHRSDLVRQELAERRNVEYVEQTERLGTGHAVKMCREKLVDHRGPVLIVTGDSPMIQVDSVRRLLQEFDKGDVSCVLGTLHKADPSGLGRVVRDREGQFVGIVEQRDASPEQQQITEVNMSTYVFDSQALVQALDQLKNDNRQREYYITDCPSILLREGHCVRALPVLKACESLSINTLDELGVVDEAMKRQQGER